MLPCLAAILSIHFPPWHVTLHARVRETLSQNRVICLVPWCELRSAVCTHGNATRVNKVCHEVKLTCHATEYHAALP